MKTIWEASDIEVGRIVGKPPSDAHNADMGWHAKHMHKIGYLMTIDEGKKYCLISIGCDGMVGVAKSKEEIADCLNSSKYVPLKIEWICKVLTENKNQMEG